MKMISLTCAVLSMGVLSHAANLSDQDQQIEAFFNKERADQGDYWLIRRNNSGADERVSVVFGFVDNEEFCEEIASDQMKKHPRADYHCERAN